MTKTPEPPENKRQRIREKSHNTRRTLRNLDRKLDKIHQDLAQVNRSRWRNEPQYRPRPLLRHNLTHKPPTTYELTPAPARVVFRIFNPQCMQWLHSDQNLAIKSPQRYEAKRPRKLDSIRDRVIPIIILTSQTEKILHTM